MTYCKNCGNELTGLERFCGGCGSQVSDPPEQRSAPMETVSGSGEATSFDQKQIFVGKNYDYYQGKWEKAESTRSNSAWNWAAFFLGPFWLAYRKMYLYVVIYIALLVVESVVEYIFDAPDSISNVVGIAIAVVLGQQGNYWYKLHAERKIAKINSESSAMGTENKLKKNGGTSLGSAFGLLTLVIACVFIYFAAVDNPLTATKAGYPKCTSSGAAKQFSSVFNGSPYARNQNLETIDVLNQKKVSESSDGNTLVCQATLMLNDSTNVVYRFTFSPAKEEGRFYITGEPAN